MAIIIAASLQLHDQAQEAVEQLKRAGFAPEKVSSFFVNPPGQHALYPIGGDEYKSPGTTSKSEAVIEEMAEAVIGVKHDKNHSEHPADRNDPLYRTGMLVAVELPDQTYQDKVVALFARLGANNIEKAEGEIVNGEWIDFDPLSEPCYL
jgi:hypothetical protein